MVCGEDAGGDVAREAEIETREGGGDSGVDAGGACGVGLGEGSEAVAEAGRVLVRYGEDSVAALGAARAADEVRPAAGRDGGEGGGYDLDEVRQWTQSRLRLLDSKDGDSGLLEFAAAISPLGGERGMAVGACRHCVLENAGGLADDEG